MDSQIFVALDEAEKNVIKLKTILENQGTTEQHPRASVNDGPTRVFSNDNLAYKKYMTLSTVKLFETRGIEVFKMDDSVGLYFIVPSNRVRTSARSAPLRIVRIEVTYQDDRHPPAFLQVGDWVYPLQPGSMVYRSEQKYYLFPDLVSTLPGSSVGVILPKTCSPEDRAQFEQLLLSLVGLEEFPTRPPDSFGKSTDLILSARTSVQVVRTNSGGLYSQRASQAQSFHLGRPRVTHDTAGGAQIHGEGQYGKRIGAGIKAGGELLCRGLELGAIGTANAISLGALTLKSTLTRETHDREIPSAVLDGVAYAKETTDKVVELSSTLLSTLADITSNFATLTACYIRATATPIVQDIVEASGINQERFNQVAGEFRDLGEGIAGGTLHVYRGLENAGTIMANAVRDQTCDVVEHCCGPSAARVLQGAGHVVGNIAVSGRNAGKVISPIKIADKTVKQTGVALCTEQCGQ